MKLIPIFLTAFLVACGGGGGGGGSSNTNVVSAAEDLTAYSTKDVSRSLSLIGNWNINMYRLGLGQPTDPVDFYGIVKLGTGQNEGIVLTGWAYDPRLAGQTQVYQTNIAIFEQKTDGTLRLATTDYTWYPNTNGASNVIVADFNSDGRDDFFLPAYNETPALATSSVAYLSRANGSFSKLGNVSINNPSLLNTGTDSVIIRDSKLIRYNNKPGVLVTANGYSGVYTYNNGAFDFVRITAGTDIDALSVTAGEFINKGTNNLVFAGAGGKVYSFTSASTVNAVADLPTPYFNDKAEYSGYVSDNPLSKTKQPKMWTDDINQDGKPDIVVGSEIYPGWRAQLQLLVNQGNGSFVDRTANNMPFNEAVGLDYSMQMVDVDRSGIMTYFMAQTDAYCATSGCRNKALHGNYILVNDGTGQFHVAMHDEFVNLGNQVIALIRATALSTDLLPITWKISDQEVPKFMAYRTADGRINFMAKATTLTNVGETLTTLVNVPLKIDLTTQFKKNITITNRNGSTNIRTFAGDDTIAGGCTSTCYVNGGLGTNTVVYSGRRSNYSITVSGAGYRVVDIRGIDGVDNLTNIQILQFADGSVTLN